MNHQRTSVALAFAAVLAVCGTGCTQHAGTGDAGQGPAAASTAPMPPAASTARPALLPAPASTSAPPAAGGTAGTPGTTFDVLAGSKGYVTHGDAQRDPWLQAHFAQCDSNHDGRVTRQEYARCHAQAEAGTPSGGATAG